MRSMPASRMIAAAGLLAVTIASAVPLAAQAPERLTVRELIRLRERLDGTEVTVRGFILSCRPQSCLLYESRRHAGNRSLFFVSLAPDAEFDRVAAANAPAYVVVRGRIDAKCVNRPPARANCPGRSAALTVSEVIEWDKSA